MTSLISPRLFPVAMFLSAGLLFAVQPLLGKQMLPLVGGSPSGWLTALAFFQLALLGGYLVAHLLSRLSARTQVLTTVGLLALGAVVLPPAFGMTAADGVAANVGSATQVLQLLFGAIFLPYLGLATVSSGLQRLYAARTAGQDPYFLYAASNAGSFAGLLAYPLVVEPFLPLSVQGVVWTVGYGLLVALIALLAWPKLVATVAPGIATAAPAAAGKDAAPTETVPAETVPAETVRAETVTAKQRLHWVILSFIPSSLSMGLTAQVAADLGSFPLLWVIPLGLYLLTFVVAFGHKRRIQAEDLRISQIIMAATALFLIIWSSGYSLSSWSAAFVMLCAFLLTALICHIQLADQRPGEKKLTEFYLWLSVGGALGGCFNAFIVPLLFTQAIEFLVTLFVGTLVVSLTVETPIRKRLLASVAGVLLIGATAAHISTSPEIYQTSMPWLLYGVIPALTAVCALVPASLGVTGLLILVLMGSPVNTHHAVAVERGFFGVLKVMDHHNAKGEVFRRFVHGSTIHGMQRIAPQRDTTLISYYGSPRDVIAMRQPKQIGLVGLGIGVMLCLKSDDTRYTVYEIDPLVKQIAMQWFDYIKNCGEPEWRIGDGRIELQKDTEKRYDLLVIDAFSSDSIPAHLLTKEAFAVYRSRLAPQGILMVHITNRYFHLQPAVAAIAAEANLQALTFVDKVIDLEKGRAASIWTMLAAPDVDLSAIKASGWQPMRASVGASVWSDDFANVMGALKILAPAEEANEHKPQ